MLRRECNCQPPFTVQLGESWVELTLPTFASMSFDIIQRSSGMASKFREKG